MQQVGVVKLHEIDCILDLNLNRLLYIHVAINGHTMAWGTMAPVGFYTIVKLKDVSSVAKSRIHRGMTINSFTNTKLCAHMILLDLVL